MFSNGWSATYKPFGEFHTSTASAIWDGPSGEFILLEPINLRFPGQWYNAESGLHQNWMRDYDPTLGRYIQADPLGLVDGASVYGYARQSPNRYTDFRGESTAGDLLCIMFPLQCSIFPRPEPNSCRGVELDPVGDLPLLPPVTNYDEPKKPEPIPPSGRRTCDFVFKQNFSTHVECNYLCRPQMDWNVVNLPAGIACPKTFLID